MDKRGMICIQQSYEMHEALIIGGLNRNGDRSTNVEPFHEVVAERKIVIDTTVDFVRHLETFRSTQYA
jgi:hypothetical protein